MPRIRLSAAALWLIAAASMTVDHAAVALFENAVWMRVIGRLAFPIIAFLLSEGMANSRSGMRYALRLALFGLLSEAPFDWALFGGWNTDHQNVLFTLALAAASMTLARGARTGTARVLPAVVAALLAQGFSCDYGAGGVAAVWIFGLFRGRPKGALRAVGAFAVLMAASGLGWVYVLALAPAALLLEGYDGRRGGQRLPLAALRWSRYVFYPAHLTVLALLRLAG